MTKMKEAFTLVTEKLKKIKNIDGGESVTRLQRTICVFLV